MSYLDIASRVIKQEAKALTVLADSLPQDFQQLVDYIINFKGKVFLTGIGKSGYIARKIAASMSSTGTVAFYIHPTEASHGDLGMITTQDLVIILSTSGESRELLSVLDYCVNLKIKVAVMTMNSKSSIAKRSDFLLDIPLIKEASLLSAPTTSTIMLLAMGDALTVALQETKNFSNEDYLLFHPGGKIGANLLKVKDLMKTNDHLPLVYARSSFSDVIITMSDRKVVGCAIVIDQEYKIIGIISDGDLRRHIKDGFNLKCAQDIMTTQPITTDTSQLAINVLVIMRKNKITFLPVVIEDKVVGIIHIHDILNSGVG
ncbi:MAG: KpsF/GutQ family sugar-phosphate isomerase [Rickettsiaceae bacterium]|nr:MAG: KpsF/GutQ family sugar-phosphate isomerase [Rickettsiaceae bacterium]